MGLFAELQMLKFRSGRTYSIRRMICPQFRQCEEDIGNIDMELPPFFFSLLPENIAEKCDVPKRRDIKTLLDAMACQKSLTFFYMIKV